MLIRFLIVALAILNLGVAAWWMAPHAAAPPLADGRESGVASLEVVPAEALAPLPRTPGPAPVAAADVAGAPLSPAAADAARAVAVPASTANQAAAAVPAPAPAAQQCLSLGPFHGRAQAQAALDTLGKVLLRSHLRQVPGKPASSYRVFIPPAPSHEQAQAMAERIVAAGFNDYFVISQGAEANAVALGQYHSREGAERRLAALTAAGFPARLEASGGEQAERWWLDLAHAGDLPAAQLQQRSGAAQRQSLDCAKLR